MKINNKELQIGDVLYHTDEKANYEVVAIHKNATQIRYMGIVSGMVTPQNTPVFRWIAPEDTPNYQLK